MFQRKLLDLVASRSHKPTRENRHLIIERNTMGYYEQGVTSSLRRKTAARKEEDEGRRWVCPDTADVRIRRWESNPVGSAKFDTQLFTAVFFFFFFFCFIYFVLFAAHGFDTDSRFRLFRYKPQLQHIFRVSAIVMFK